MTEETGTTKARGAVIGAVEKAINALRADGRRIFSATEVYAQLFTDGVEINKASVHSAVTCTAVKRGTILLVQKGSGQYPDRFAVPADILYALSTDPDPVRAEAPPVPSINYDEVGRKIYDLLRQQDEQIQRLQTENAALRKDAEQWAELLESQDKKIQELEGRQRNNSFPADQLEIFSVNSTKPVPPAEEIGGE